MPRVRVQLTTYRRPALLPRALASLRAQTFTDWICELHNDAPDDPFPAELVARTADPRITLVTHPRNLGAMETFNLLFQTPVPEDYICLLEDDNWWEPEFLTTMVATLDAHPAVELAWANMRYWEELPDGNWRDRGDTIWESARNGPKSFEWPQLLQCTDALLSNGATLMRAKDASRHLVPVTAALASVEAVRERTFRHPVLFVPQPLANFAITRETARSGTTLHWLEVQLILAATFFEAVPLSARARAQLWEERRQQRPRSTNLLFHVAFATQLRLLGPARWRDWLDFLRSCLAHPVIAWRLFQIRRRHRPLWEFLASHTRARTEDARQRGFTVLDAGSLMSKRPAAT